VRKVEESCCCWTAASNCCCCGAGAKFEFNNKFDEVSRGLFRPIAAEGKLHWVHLNSHKGPTNSGLHWMAKRIWSLLASSLVGVFLNGFERGYWRYFLTQINKCLFY
jgi:hypothetical protein